MKSSSWSSYQAALPQEARAGGEPSDDVCHHGTPDGIHCFECDVEFLQDELRALDREADELHVERERACILADACASELEQEEKQKERLKARIEMYGTLPHDDGRRAFIDGARWMHWQITGATLFPSEQDEVEAEAERRHRKAKKSTDKRHKYIPHPKYPWFCETCGYSEYEKLMHIQNEEE